MHIAHSLIYHSYHNELFVSVTEDSQSGYGSLHWGIKPYPWSPFSIVFLLHLHQPFSQRFHCTLRHFIDYFDHSFIESFR